MKIIFSSVNMIFFCLFIPFFKPSHMIKYFISALVILLFASSCSSVKEQFVFNKKGNGQYSVEYDLGGMVGLMQMMGGDESDEPDLDGGPGLPEEFEDMDTTMNLYTFAPDSVKSKMEQPELLKKVNVIMKMNEANQEMLMCVSMDFDQFSQLDDIIREMKNIGQGQGMQSELIENQPFLPSEGFSAYYTKKKKGFSKKESVIDMDKMTDQLDSEIDLGEMGGMMDMLFTGADFITTIKVPKKIKKVTCDCTYKIVDKKTVELQFPMSDIVKNKKMPAYSIDF